MLRNSLKFVLFLSHQKTCKHKHSIFKTRLINIQMLWDYPFTILRNTKICRMIHLLGIKKLKCLLCLIVCIRWYMEKILCFSIIGFHETIGWFPPIKWHKKKPMKHWKLLKKCAIMLLNMIKHISMTMVNILHQYSQTN